MKRALFVVETNYQMMYATIVNYYLKKNNFTTAVISLLGESIKTGEFAGFDKIYNLETSNLPGSGFKNIVREFVFLKNNLDDLENFKFEFLIVFKDSNYLQGFLINRLKKTNKVKTILLEEGLSLYRDDILPYTNIKFMLKHIIRNVILVLLGAKGARIGFGYNKNVDAIGAYFPEKISNIKAKSKSLIKLPHCPPNSEAFNRLNNLFEFEVSDDFSESKCIIFLGQPLSETGICSSENEQRFLLRLNEIAQKNEITILVKPHPRERIEKYSKFINLLIIDSHQVSAELIINYYKPHLLLTWFSSAGNIANTWWGIKTLFLYKLLNLNIEIKGLGEVNYCESFSDLEELLMDREYKVYNYFQRNELEIDKEYNEFVSELIKK